MPSLRSPSASAKSSKNSGYVFSTQPGFSIRTPGIRSPASAKLIAMRWSLYVSIVAGRSRPRLDRQAVVALVDVRAELAQLGRQRGDAVGFLVADVGDVADRRRPVGEQRDDGQRLHGVADRVHVDVDAVQRAADDGDRIRVAAHFAAHLLQAIDERDVALQAVGRQSFDGDFAAGDRRRRPEVARGRSVGLDRVLACRVWLRRGDLESRRIRRPVSTSTPNARITASVIRTYGCDTSGPSIASSTGERAAGAAISRPLRNWLEMSPRTVAVPPGKSVGVDDHRRAAVVVFARSVRAQLVRARRASRRSAARASARRRPAETSRGRASPAP